MRETKFLKDPKIRVISIEEYLKSCNYFADDNLNLWKEFEKPSYGRYYKITPEYLLLINYTYAAVNFGLDLAEKLESVLIAIRDGKTEYEMLEIKKKELLEKKKRQRKIKKIEEQIINIEKGEKLLRKIKYCSEQIPIEGKRFTDYLTDVGYKTSNESLLGKYVVFDVETNGLRKSNDDLLSISIYDPSSGKCYNRHLPLDLQPLVLTGWINGISENELKNEQHITQEELNQVIDFFDLKNKTLLSFSGGAGTFDSSFIINYCKRHNLIGFEDLHYENIKSMCPRAGYGFEGKMTKDNLCGLLGIKGVQKVHSSLNDCILEWKLFEKIYNQPLFFIGQDLFKYHDGYIVPVTYLNKHPDLVAFAGISVPDVVGKANCIFEYELPEKVVRKVKKFPTNITGISLEHSIYCCLNAEEQDNSDFLIKNKRNLEYIGSLGSNITQIPVQLEKDGTVSAMDSNFKDYVKDVNEITIIITESISPVLEFIKNNIFRSETIYSQELCISDDQKVLALCDLSDRDNVLEIKTFAIVAGGESIDKQLATQLYYQSKGRKTFVLSIQINPKFYRNGVILTDAVNVKIYSITLEESSPKPLITSVLLFGDELEVLKIIKDHPDVSNMEIAKMIYCPYNRICRIIKKLQFLKYIEKEDQTKRKSAWVLLRKIEERSTKLWCFNGEIKPLFEDD